MEEKTLQNRTQDKGSYQYNSQNPPIQGQYEPYPEDFLLDSQHYHRNANQVQSQPEDYTTQSPNTIDYQNVVRNQHAPNTQSSTIQQASQDVAPQEDRQTEYSQQQSDYYNAPNNINNPNARISQTDSQTQERPKAKNFLENFVSQSQMNNEKFIVIALLAAVILTSVIIGLGWSLLSPQKAKNVLPSQKELQTESTADEFIDETNLTNGQDIQEDVTIVYGTQSTQETNTPEASTSPPTRRVNTTTQASPISPKSTKVQTPTPKQVPKSTTPVVVNSAPAVQDTRGTSIQNKESNAQKSIPSTQSSSSSSNTSLMSSDVIKPNSKSNTLIQKTPSLYWIQIFSTTNKDKILQIHQNFVNKGLNPSIFTKLISNKLYYRLRLGPFNNKQEGNKFLNWIKEDTNYKDSYLIISS